MEIRPQAPYTISFFLTDHTDTTTYYCRGVVYDTTTGEVLETHNLTQTSGNDRLFSKRVQAPGDSSGMGRKITVVATAYTDSGYTSKATTYQEQAENYFVIKAPILGGGGGYGVGVDYRAIREMMQEEIAKIPKPEKVVIPEFPEIPESEKVELDGITEAVDRVGREIGKKIDAISFAPILNSLESLKMDISEIDIPETDLSPILDQIDILGQQLATKEDSEISMEGMKAELADVVGQTISTTLPKVAKDIFMYRAMAQEHMTAQMADSMWSQDKTPTKTFDIKKII